MSYLSLITELSILQDQIRTLQGEQNINEKIAFCKSVINLYPNDIYAYYELSMALFSKEEFAQIIHVCKQIVQKFPHTNFGYTFQILALERLEQWTNVVEICNQAIVSLPIDLMIYVSKFEALKKLKLFQEILLNCNQMLNNFQLGNFFYQEKAKVLQELEDIDGALQCLDDGAKNGFQNLDYEKGKLLVKCGRFFEALKQQDFNLKKVFRSDYGLRESFQWQAHTLKGQQKIDEMIYCYERAIQYFPRHIGFYQDLVYELQSLNKFKEIEKIWDISIQNNPDNINLYHQKKMTLKEYLSLDKILQITDQKIINIPMQRAQFIQEKIHDLMLYNKFKEAILIIDELFLSQQDQNYQQLVSIKNMCLQKLSQNAQTLDIYEDADIETINSQINESPFDIELYNKKSQTLLYLKKYDELKQLQYQMIKLFPKSFQTYQKLSIQLIYEASLLQMQKSSEEIIQISDQAIEQGFSNYFYEKAKALENIGKIDEMLRVLKQYIDYCPNNSKIFQYYGNILLKYHKFLEYIIHNDQVSLKKFEYQIFNQVGKFDILSNLNLFREANIAQRLDKRIETQEKIYDF